MTESSNVHVSGDTGAEGAWRWWQRIGCPRHVCAPMVWNSELAFRLLVRKHDVHLTYTPMIVASRFLALKTNAERLALIEPHADDRPLVVQFAADNPETLVAAGRLAQDYCDAIDLNLGCPQPQAVRDHYGSILMEEPELVEAMVKAASSHLKVPITVKIRIFADLDRSIKFAKMLEFAGASAIAVHGRTSSCTHHEGECSWDAIRAIKAALNIPVIANGGPIRSREDADLCLAHTGADAVMSAIGLLLDPRLFTRTCAEKYDTIETALEYCDAARQVASTPAISMRQHLMAILRQDMCPAWYRRGGTSADHLDLWTLMCGNKIRSAAQCRQLVLTLAARLRHPAGPSHVLPPLSEIKRNVKVGETEWRQSLGGPAHGEEEAEEEEEYVLDF